MFQPVTAAIVECQHASHGRHFRITRVGPEHTPVFGQILIEASQNYTRLKSDGLAIEAQNTTHGMSEIDDDSRTQRFAG